VRRVDSIPSVDQLIEANIVADLAEKARLPVAANMVNEAVSLAIRFEVAQPNEAVITKPRIIDTRGLARGILVYMVQDGDTVRSIAEAHRVTTTTVRWANGFRSYDDLRVGYEILIPSVDGVVHVVVEGDTVERLAERYEASAESIRIFNDLELGDMSVGQRILVPGGRLPERDRPEFVPPPPPPPARPVNPGHSWATFGSNFTFLYVNTRPTSPGNRHFWGNCTWYAWEHRARIGRPLPSVPLGNANVWHISLANHGFLVNRTPAVGAVAQTSAGGGGMGHVMVVTAILYNGDVVMQEMNAMGFNVVSQRIVPAAQAGHFNYIH